LKTYTYGGKKSESGLKVFKYTCSSCGKNDKHFLVISDLHFFKEKDFINLDRILKEASNKDYDAILLVGDILDQTSALEDEQLTKKILWFLASLGKILPTYVVYGNHDLGHYFKNLERPVGSPWITGEKLFKERFESIVSSMTGVFILNNRTAILDDGYTVSGINPSVNYFSNPLENFQIILDEIDLSFLTTLDSQSINILMCHYPNVIFELHRLVLLKNVDLCVCGHNHNGCTQLKVFPLEQILNFIGCSNRGLITPNMSMKLGDTKHLRGVVELDDNTNLVINHNIKTFSACSEKLEVLDPLFYRGVSSLEFVPEKEFVMKLKK